MEVAVKDVISGIKNIEKNDHRRWTQYKSEKEEPKLGVRNGTGDIEYMESVMCPDKKKNVQSTHIHLFLTQYNLEGPYYRCDVCGECVSKEEMDGGCANCEHEYLIQYKGKDWYYRCYKCGIRMPEREMRICRP